jgi:hypothetical protein
MKNNTLTLAGILITAAIVILVLFGLVFALKGADNAISLPILAIAGVILLLATLALVSVAFALFELDDKNQALALPEGSIRAVIALSLIVLFAILSVYLYSTLLNKPADTPNVDFAKQLLVLVGTLVTSVAGFYFGSRATAAPPTEALSPEIRGISPTSQIAGATFPLTISGDRLDLVKEVKIVSGSNQVVATDVVSNASTIKCELSLPQDATGAWDVIVTDGLGRTGRLPSALTVNVAPNGSPPSSLP